MVSVLLLWAVIFITTYMAGYAVIAVLTNQEPVGAMQCSFGGLVLATVFAQLWSLFAGVGMPAFLCFTVLSAAGCMTMAKRTGKQCFGFRKTSPAGMLIVLAMAVLFAYGGSRGYIHYDTGLYHAQSIHWIETYGIVPGLANLHTRLGYNSSAFAVTALFSFHRITGQSFHAVQGYLALLLALESLKIVDVLSGKRTIVVSDFIRLGAWLYLFQVFDEIVSPASDYFMVLTAFYIVIRFLDLTGELNEAGDERKVCDRIADQLGLLALLAVCCVTFKLSSVCLLLIAVLPAWIWIREKRFGRVALFLLLGTLIMLPYLVRNVILTGYLVYPYPSIDLFKTLVWKVPSSVAFSDQREIGVYGRGYTDVSMYAAPLSFWLKNWFSQQAGLNKLFLFGSIVSVPVGLFFCIRFRRNLGIVLAQITLLSSTLFWFKSAPLMRYGCVFVYCFVLLNIGLVCLFVLEKLPAQTDLPAVCLRAVIGLFLVYKIFAVGKEQAALFQNDYWICQKEYENFETTEYLLDGITFARPVSGDRVGYEAFPSTPTDRSAEVYMLGENIKDGFAPKQ